MIVNNTKIYKKMKHKSLLSVEKTHKIRKNTLL